MGYVVAKYIRLSIEDAKTESLSIPNQRLMLDRYIEDMGREDIQALEFVDNGYSGTNFLRPGVTELLELVASGEIDCIICKDFSRFGRNMIDTGYYIEKLFPLYRVRFISLGDGYDSADSSDDRSLTFPLLVNELYSQDLSRKISAAWESRARRGESATKNCLFGYRLDENKNMVIDSDVAETVRRIFELAMEGRGFASIARSLCAEGRLTPSAHKGRCKDQAFACVWSVSAIRSILLGEQYTGVFLAGRTTALQVGSKQQLQQPTERWIRIPEHHPAIISREEFDTVQEMLHAKTKNTRGRKYPGPQSVPDIPLKGKVICDCCDHIMMRQAGKHPKFRCRFTLSAPHAECHRLEMDESDLEQQVLAAIRERGVEQINTALLQPDEPSTECKPEGIRELYELYRAGTIDLETFRGRKASLQACSQTSTGARRDVRRKSVEHPGTAQVLTRELVEHWVDRVMVSPAGVIDIRWRQ